MAAVLFNVTIDDEAGDEMTGDKPTYTPSGSSGNWEQGATCSKCVAKPDPSEAFGGTWHDTTHNPRDPFQRAIEISFTGALNIETNRGRKQYLRILCKVLLCTLSSFVLTPSNMPLL